MKRYTLDANVVAALLKGNEQVVNRLREVVSDDDEVTLNAICYYEVRRGLYLPRFERRLTEFTVFVNDYGVLPLDTAGLDIAVDIYQAMRVVGTPLEDADLLMAAIARAHGATLVTRNTKHLARVDGLQIEDWENGS